MTRQRSPPEKSNVIGSDLIKNTKSEREKRFSGGDIPHRNISRQTLSSVDTGYSEHLQDGTGCRGKLRQTASVLN